MALPLVTVIVPVRDEEERIAGCLEALAASDLPCGQVEVLVVDGGSTDATAGVAARVLAAQGWWRGAVLSSTAGDRSSNLNCGLAAASAAVLVRVDARSRVPAGYLRRCLEQLASRGDVAVVGGRQRAVATGRRALEIGVARALNNRWGMGLARYRRPGSQSGPADTVYLGAYRTAQVRAAGGWRTHFSVNEDFDLNRRLSRFGMVWFDAGLAVDYLPRASLRALVRQYWDFGVGKARYWRTSGDPPRPRQLVLLAAPLAGLAVVAGSVAVFGPAVAFGLAAAGAALVVAGEALGADGPQAGAAAHLAAVLALACVAGPWLAGVAAGMVRPVPGGDGAGAVLERAA